MKIIILGAGQAGSSVADNLASEDDDLTIVDINAAVLHDLQDKLDLSTVQGVASPSASSTSIGSSSSSSAPIARASSPRRSTERSCSTATPPTASSCSKRTSKTWMSSAR